MTSGPPVYNLHNKQPQPAWAKQPGVGGRAKSGAQVGLRWRAHAPDVLLRLHVKHVTVVPWHDLGGAAVDGPRLVGGWVGCAGAMENLR